MLGPGDEPHPAADLGHGQAPAGLLARGHERIDRRAGVERIDLQGLGDPLERERRIGGEEEGLQLAEPLGRHRVQRLRIRPRSLRRHVRSPPRGPAR